MNALVDSVIARITAGEMPVIEADDIASIRVARSRGLSPRTEITVTVGGLTTHATVHGDDDVAAALRAVAEVAQH